MDGGVNATDNPTLYRIDSELTLNNPTKTGYDFDGWYLDADKTEKVNLSNFGIGNKTLYAKWTPKTYIVEYSANGGNGTMAKSEHTYDVSKNLSINLFTRTGYQFVGWAVSQDGLAVYGDGESVTNLPDSESSSAVCLYAVWKANPYKVVYNANGGVGSMSSSDFVYDQSDRLSKNGFSRKGYTFIGWSKSSASKIAEYTDTQTVKNLTSAPNGIVNLYAVWKPNEYIITFDKQNGTDGTSSIGVTYDDNMRSAAPPKRTGYTFKGYFSEKNGGGTQYYDASSPMKSVNTWKNDYSATLYAYWEKTVYTITFDNGEGCSSRYYTTTVTYGEAMPRFIYYAPKCTGYEFEGYYSKPNGQGIKYYSMKLDDEKQSAIIYGYDHYYIETVQPIGNWNVNGNAKLYANWKVLRCEYAYENICLNPDECISTTTVSLEHGKAVTLTAKSISGYTFKYFTYKFQQYSQTQVTLQNIQLQRRAVDGKIRPTEYFSAVYEKDECVAEGTLITLADGRQVPVETLTGNETLLVWNLQTGAFDAAKILFIDKDPVATYKVINLTFSDGTTVKVISEHGFWDCGLNQYVYLSYDAEKYVGHWFNKQTVNENGELTYTEVQLVNVEITEEQTAAYSPVTASHLCYYVNGMLSMPGGISGMFNIFEVDGETMTIDEEAYARDVERYGLYTYEEFAELVPVTEEVFRAFNGQYLKVAVGKGLINIDTLRYLAQRYAEFFE